MTVVLLDAGSYNYYRATATLSWYRHQKGAPPPSIDNEYFLGKLRDQYFSCLDKFYKKVKQDLKITIDSSDIYYIRDSPREGLWRSLIYPEYKGNRADRETRECDRLSKLEGEDRCLALGQTVGQYIKYLHQNCATTFRQSLRVDGAEADDIIAVVTRDALAKGATHVIIVSMDSDFNQLLSDSRVKIYNPKGWSRAVCTDPKQALVDKILNGDTSDCIRKVSGKPDSESYRMQYNLNRQLIDFDCIPEHIRDAILIELWGTIPDAPSDQTALDVDDQEDIIRDDDQDIIGDDDQDIIPDDQDTLICDM